MTEIFREAAEKLREIFPQAEYLFNERMSRHTTFAIGGPVGVMFFPRSGEETAALRKILREMNITPLIIGNGSNLLCSDEYMDLAVIKTKGLNEITVLENGSIRFGAGIMMRTAAEKALELGLTGLEFAHGIPGSIGGGAFMNAGAYGGELAGVIVSVRVCDKDGNIYDIPADELDYAYRHSRFEETDELIVSVLVKLNEGDREQIKSTMLELREKRVSKQPLDKPSAGSTFKRPAGGYAAAMIDGAGLKGKGVGGARVSEKHAGFVVSDGTASCSDVIGVMRMVRAEVLEKYGVLLEPEVRLIGTEL